MYIFIVGKIKSMKQDLYLKCLEDVMCFEYTVVCTKSEEATTDDWVRHMKYVTI